jgi:hypothetical protein
MIVSDSDDYLCQHRLNGIPTLPALFGWSGKNVIDKNGKPAGNQDR